MDSRLQDKVVVVTGASNGIGAAIARMAAEKGARVVIADVADEAGIAYAETLKGEGLEARFLHLDVTSYDNWESALAETADAYGKIDGLVNCAGISQSGMPLLQLDLKRDWDLIIDIDLKGPFYGMRTVIPYLQKNGGGSIVNIGSVAGLTAQCGTNGYTAAKGGIIALTRAAAIEFAKDYIRCNTVCPSVTMSQNVKDIFANYEGAEESQLRELTYPRFGEPEDIAGAVVFMLSDEASYVTGQTLCVDGGYTAA